MTVGTDAHENSFPIMLRDGERGDSYRRLLRWADSPERLIRCPAERTLAARAAMERPDSG